MMVFDCMQCFLLSIYRESLRCLIRTLKHLGLTFLLYVFIYNLHVLFLITAGCVATYQQKSDVKPV